MTGTSDNAAPSQETSTPTVIPVKEILIEAISLPGKYLVIVGRFAAPLLAVLFLALIVPLVVSDSTVFSGGRLLVTLLWVVAFLVAATLATVACHRIFILGPESMSGHKLFWWSWRELRFAGWVIAISLVILVVGIFVGPLIVGPIMLTMTQFGEPNVIGLSAASALLFLPAAYIVGRLSLVLPATAVDERPSLDWAWDISRGNGLRLMVLVGLFPILADFLYSLLPAGDSLAYNASMMLVYLYAAATEVAILSLSYRALVNGPRESES